MTPPDPATTLRTTLARARREIIEDPAGAIALTEEAEADARAMGDRIGRVRALVLRGLAMLQEGDLATAFRLCALAENEGAALRSPDLDVEVAGFRAQLAFFTGGYREALEHAHAAIAAADAAADAWLGVYARRSACIVLGNLEDPGWPDEARRMIALCETIEDPWETAASHNDLATMALLGGDSEEALAALDRADAEAARVTGHSDVLRALLGVTRAQVQLAAGRPDDAVATVTTAMERLAALAFPSPYLLGMTVLVRVQALLAAGDVAAAAEAGSAGLARLGDTTPHARAMVLRELAEALRGAGRLEAAYEALAECAELERVVAAEFAELRLEVERATAAGAAARREADALREQAERDPLTGLHNRRHLLRVFAAATAGETTAVAVIDLDRFKTVNDRFGHDVGDHVLRRAGLVLRASARSGDLVARLGGEEFVVVMPHTELAAAALVCERLRAQIEGEDWSRYAPGLTLTASIGVAAAPLGLDPLMLQADRHMYAAKRAGRNRVASD